MKPMTMLLVFCKPTKLCNSLYKLKLKRQETGSFYHKGYIRLKHMILT